MAKLLRGLQGMPPVERCPLRARGLARCVLGIAIGYFIANARNVEQMREISGREPKCAKLLRPADPYLYPPMKPQCGTQWACVTTYRLGTQTPLASRARATFALYTLQYVGGAAARRAPARGGALHTQLAPPPVGVDTFEHVQCSSSPGVPCSPRPEPCSVSESLYSTCA